LTSDSRAVDDQEGLGTTVIEELWMLVSLESSIFP
jgi:hypothetical protein